MMFSAEDHAWWQRGIIYQVYPRSFQDTDGDGVGDLRGIRQRLDYLQWLGVDAIWISPIYPSPMKDFGYDVADYCGIHPMFGDLEEFDQLIQDAHARGLKVILDFVPNHTSDQHPWFLESRKSRTNPKADWFLWQDPAPGGGPPNNWLSCFGGSAWEWCEERQQYYHHAFLPEQADLNWRNPEVVEAMLGVLRFWLERGVDGFRVDVIYHIIKDELLRDNPVNPDYKPHMPSYDSLSPIYSTDRPEVHDVIAKMRKLLDSFPGDRVLIGEAYLPIERLMMYYGPDGGGTHMPYNFQLILLPWNARVLDQVIAHYEASLPKNGWPNWVVGNHDKPRVASRVGREQARVAMMLLLTLRGTPTMYYGDEIAMADVKIAPDQVQDPFEIREPGRGNGRDPQRTPMQWDRSPQAGFTTGRPWLPISKEYEHYNVEVQRADAKSMLTLTKRLIELRRREPALNVGDYRAVSGLGHILAYRREANGDPRFLIVLNLDKEPVEFRLHGDDIGSTIELSTHLDRAGEVVGETVTLRGDEGVIIRVKAQSETAGSVP